MSWDATIFGTLTMPPAAYKKWLTREVDSAKVPDAAKWLSTLEVNGDTVKKTLGGFSKFKDPDGIAFLDLKKDPTAGTVEVRSFFSKDEYLDHCVALAAVWAAAAPEGTGELYFTGMLTASFCQLLTVSAKGVTLKPLRNSAADKLPTYKEILEKVEGRIAHLGL